ncbi:MAG: cell filamentation protein Fic, partial [Oscillospiraceae bacterium]|nr:cell filamentation protein Fic [Oscillospiraceae bacterium]
MPLEIDRLKTELDAKRPLTSGELSRFREEFITEFTHDSTAIEGNTLTLQETERVLQGVTIAGKPLSEHLEAIGHRDAFVYVEELVRDKTELTEREIKRIHSLVLLDKPDDRGRYRSVPVRVGEHTPPQPYLVPVQI